LFSRTIDIAVDVVFPVMHGTYGEDGTLQGLLELADVPYVGCRVVGSAVGMDKVLTKAAFQQNGLPVVDYLWFPRRRWESKPEAVLDRIEATLSYPVFVKPANLGSSVGISKAGDREELEFALEVASQYDRKLLVEQGIINAQEINCAVMGNEEIVPSACEEPLSWEEFLKYEDKYLRGAPGKGMKGSQRRVPAEIPEELTLRVQELAVAAFQAIDGMGTARVDLLIDRDSEQVYVNEVNTLPGSMAFHLWQPVGLTPAQVVDNLIQLAFDAWEDTHRTTFSYATPILEQADL
jgi:D-alanine-D-alanine ligase